MTAGAVALAAVATGTTDTPLRYVSFFGALLSAVLLGWALWLKSVPVRTLTTGQVLAQGGFMLLIVSVIYGTGEALWHWYHIRLWVLAVAVVWSAAGCGYLVAEQLHDRRQLRELADTGTIPAR